jgi:hypothetical protein
MLIKVSEETPPSKLDQITSSRRMTNYKARNSFLAFFIKVDEGESMKENFRCGICVIHGFKNGVNGFVVSGNKNDLSLIPLKIRRNVDFLKDSNRVTKEKSG